MAVQRLATSNWQLATMSRSACSIILSDSLLLLACASRCNHAYSPISPVTVIPVDFRGDLWHQKTRISGLSCGVVCVILRLAVLVELQLVTDRQTQAHG